MPDNEPDADELLAIIERDGAPTNAYTTDRKLLGAIATCTDYMIGGRIFLPTDPEQAEEALIKGTGVVLWRQRPGPLEQELAKRDRMHAESVRRQKSINEVWLEDVKEKLPDWIRKKIERGSDE